MAHDPLTVIFTVRDMTRSLAFYRDVLGFEVEAAWPDEGRPLWANLVLGTQALMIGAQMSGEAIDGMCAGDDAKAQEMHERSAEFERNKPGVGVAVYVRVPDVDAHWKKARQAGAEGIGEPTTQFYGLRDFEIEDPDGYRLMIYTPVAMESCQSCGMPLADAEPGTMYCGYCVDEGGKLKPYDVVLEGTVTGYFMGMQKMPRAEAEKAARAHLAKMPAWQGR